MHRHCDAQKSIDRFEFFANQAQRNVVEARAAIIFGNANTEQIQLGHLVEDRPLKVLLLVPFFDVGRDFFLGKFAHSLDQSFVVVGKLKIDHGLRSRNLDEDLVLFYERRRSRHKPAVQRFEVETDWSSITHTFGQALSVRQNPDRT